MKILLCPLMIILMITEASSANPNISLALLNVSGIDTSLDLVINYLETHHIDIILLTKTFLLRGNLFTKWTQHHNYAVIHGNAQKGTGGLSFLIRPGFPFHVHALPITSSH